MSPRRRFVPIGLVIAALVGCGGTAAEQADPPDVPPNPTTTFVASGTELAGLAFDVRRDPG